MSVATRSSNSAPCLAPSALRSCDGPGRIASERWATITGRVHRRTRYELYAFDRFVGWVVAIDAHGRPTRAHLRENSFSEVDEERGDRCPVRWHQQLQRDEVRPEGAAVRKHVANVHLACLIGHPAERSCERLAIVHWVVKSMIASFGDGGLERRSKGVGGDRGMSLNVSRPSSGRRAMRAAMSDLLL